MLIDVSQGAFPAAFPSFRHPAQHTPELKEKK